MLNICYKSNKIRFTKFLIRAVSEIKKNRETTKKSFNRQESKAIKKINTPFLNLYEESDEAAVGAEKNSEVRIERLKVKIRSGYVNVL